MCSSDLNGDCRTILPSLPAGLIVTDPPYNVGYHYEGYADNLKQEEYDDLLRLTCKPPCVVIHYVEDLFGLAFVLKEVPKKVVAWVYPSNTGRQWRGVAWWGCKPDFTKAGQPYKNPTDRRIAVKIAADRKSTRLNSSH